MDKADSFGRHPLQPSLAIADTLAQARRSGHKLAAPPEPTPATLPDAYALQALVTRALGWKPRGFKVGATSVTAQAMLGIDQPFSASLFEERLFGSGDRVPTSAESLRVVEPEVSFVLRDGLPPRAEPYALREVLAAVESVHPALEVADPRLPNGLAQPLPWLIADGGINDAFVLGAGVAPLAADEYALLQVRAQHNGAWVTSGSGANALGSPAAVLTWLAHHLPTLGLELRAGDIVTTGLLTGVIMCQPGDHVMADFAALGCVSARF